jgi:hypothetical protein
MTDVRCPCCREVLSTDALRPHVRGHSLVTMLRTLWRSGDHVTVYLSLLVLVLVALGFALGLTLVVAS